MEFALDLYATGGRNQTALMVAQMEIGEILLDEVGRLEAKTSDATRWEWAIGQQALSDGQFHGARVLLTRACQRYRHQPALLVACGTVHETFASFNISSAAVRQVVGVMTPTTSEPSTEALESLVRLKTDLRITYLSRLFLGRVREKQKRFDEAIRC
jgi:hypothetical protein